MIPITMSYFVGHRGGVAQAVTFCIGIIVLFTAFGGITTLVLGPAGVVALGSNPGSTVSSRWFSSPSA